MANLLVGSVSSGDMNTTKIPANAGATTQSDMSTARAFVIPSNGGVAADQKPTTGQLWPPRTPNR